MKKICSVLLIVLHFYNGLQAQKVSGDWYGVGIVGIAGEHNDYMSELVLKQRGKRISGELNYFFRSAYIPLKINGTYNDRERLLELNVTPVLNYKSKDINGADCAMKGFFRLKVSRIANTLTGTFEPLKGYHYTCPPIYIRFTQRLSNEPEEELAVEEKEPIPDSVKAPATAQTTPPLTQLATPPVTVSEPINVKPDSAVLLVKKLTERTFEESQVIVETVDSLKIYLYDNGTVDDDTISLFLNRRLLGYRQKLSERPITYTIALDTTVSELSMYAENLGTLPPNTALCVVMAGTKRYELNMTSNFTKNSTIRFRKKTAEEVRVDKLKF